MLGWLDEGMLRDAIEAERNLAPEAAKSHPWLMGVVEKEVGQRIHRRLESCLGRNSGTYFLEPFTRDSSGNKWFYDLDERKFFVQKGNEDRVIADPRDYIQPKLPAVWELRVGES